MLRCSIFLHVVVIFILANAPAAEATCPSADLTNDCWVDVEDLAVMANQWLTGEPPIPPDMIYIPAGEFEMGRHNLSGDSDELPIHAVYVDAFYVSQYEITNQQYCDFLSAADVKVDGGIVYAAADDDNSYPYFTTYPQSSRSQIDYTEDVFTVRTRDSYSMAEHPVVLVNYYGAAAYCNWRSETEGFDTCHFLGDPNWACDFTANGYRVPTEAEWEYAARGGCHDPYYPFPWCSNAIDCSMANYAPTKTSYCNPLSLTAEPYTTPVGYYQANSYGLFDMLGNVWEICYDWFDPSYYDYSPYANPTGPEEGSLRVLRSGSWENILHYTRIASRGTWHYDVSRYDNVGFRIVLIVGN